MKRLLPILMLLASSISIQAQTLSIREIVRTNDVLETQRKDSISWYQGESVQYDLYVKRDTNAVVIPTNTIVRWVVADATKTNYFVSRVGTVETDVVGHVRILLPITNSALPESTAYESEVVLYQALGGVTTYVGTVDRTGVKVLWSPLYSDELVVPIATNYVRNFIDADSALSNRLEQIATNVPAGGSATNATLLNSINGPAHISGESNVMVVTEGMNIRIRAIGVATGTPVYAETDAAARMAVNVLSNAVDALYLRNTGGNINGDVVHTGDYTLVGDFIGHNAGFNSISIGPGWVTVTNISDSPTAHGAMELMFASAIQAAIAAGGSWITNVVPTNAPAGVASVSGKTLAIGTNIPVSGAEGDPVWIATEKYYRVYGPGVTQTPTGVVVESSGMESSVASNSFVAKTGDTMTGALAVDASGSPSGLVLRSSVPEISIGMTATGAATGIAVGQHASSSNSAISIGNNSKAALQGIAIGTGANATYNNKAIAIGDGAVSYANGVSIGTAANSFGNSCQSVAIGYAALAAENACISIGLNAFSYGYSSVAIGMESEAAYQSVSIGSGWPGYGAVGAQSIAIGVTPYSGIGSIAIGEAAVARGSRPASWPGGAIAVGGYASAGTNSIALGNLVGRIEGDANLIPQLGSSNIMIGTFAKCAPDSVNTIALGQNVSNGISGSARIRGTLYLDGATGIYTRAVFGAGDWTWSYIPTRVCTGSVDVTTVVPISVPCHLINVTSQKQWTCFGTTNDWK